MSIPEKMEFHMRLLEVIMPLATYINMRIVIAKPGLDGAHDSLIPKICEQLVENRLGSVIVFAGGIIPERDIEALFRSGVRAVFGPGTPTSDVLDFLNKALIRKQNGNPVGVGDDLGWNWND